MERSPRFWVAIRRAARRADGWLWEHKRGEGALRRHITSAVWAAAIVALSASVGSVRPPTALHWLGTLADAVPTLAMHALAIAGRRGGPDGLPPIPEIILLTFVLWWVIVEFVRALWRRVRARHVSQPPA